LMNVDGQCKFRRGPKQGFAAVLLTDWCHSCGQEVFPAMRRRNSRAEELSASTLRPNLWQN
jgi:hypothetical protein